MPVEVTVADKVTDEIVTAFTKLIPQLSSSSPAPTKADLLAIVDHQACHLLLAHDTATGALIGSLTLIVFPIPTGLRAWIEDVVVDGDARGSGAGTALNTFAVDLSRRLGAKTVDLTSRPARAVANRLYVRLGFEQRETNCYRYNL